MTRLSFRRRPHLSTSSGISTMAGLRGLASNKMGYGVLTAPVTVLATWLSDFATNLMNNAS